MIGRFAMVQVVALCSLSRVRRDLELPAGAVDVFDRERDHLRHGQTGGINCREGCSHLEVRLGLQEADDLVLRQHGGQCPPCGRRGCARQPALAERCAMEEAQGADGRIDRRGLEAASHEVQPALPNILDPEPIWPIGREKQ